MTTLSNKTILVTGASRGIGRAIAVELGRAGANMCVNYRTSEQQADDVVAEIKKGGGNAIAAQADVANPAQVARMVKKIQEAFGAIFGIVNNAGASISHAQFINTPWEEFEKHFAVQIRGIYNTAQSALPDMMQNKSGSIVNIATSYTREEPPARLAPYVTAKHGVVGFTQSLAAELERHHIRVNAVSPGFIETDLTRDLPRIVHEAEAGKMPGGHLATPEDVAREVVFLMSEEAESITGTNRPVAINSGS